MNRFSLLIGAVVMCLLLPVLPAAAHGSVAAGDYTVEIGFVNEPPLAGYPNTLVVIVTNHKANAPVIGLQDTLQGELINGASRLKVKLEPVEGADGTYQAAVLLTDAGDYTCHVTGSIEKLPVDISMTSGPTTFNSTVPPSDISFPRQQPSVMDIQAAQAAADRKALAGIIIAVIAAVLGAAGLTAALVKGRSRAKVS